MQKTYCSSCGSKVEYSLNKPKFCSSCGEPLGVMSMAKKITRRGSIGSPQEEVHGDETNYAHVPNIGKLEYDVDYDSDKKLRTITLEDLKQDAEQRRRQST